MAPGHRPEKFFNDVQNNAKNALPQVDRKNDKSHKADPLATKVCDFVTSSILNEIIVDLNYASSKMLCGKEPIAANVTFLDLSNQNLDQLPNNLTSMNRLEKLFINNNKLLSLPETIDELINLKELNANCNQLTDISEKLGNLKYLETLDLSNNVLRSLPKALQQLNSLKTVILCKNAITALPECIATGMNILETIDVSHNPCIKLNITPNTRSLRKFLASENRNCGKFPSWLLTPKFSNVQMLNLDRTDFDAYCFMDMKGELQLKTFSMCQSNLYDDILEKLVSNMVALEKLNLGSPDATLPGNSFWIQPFQECNIAKVLVELNLRGTGLSLIPSTIKCFSKLVILDLGANSLTWLPEDICELDKLEILTVDNNKMVLLPKMIGNMTALKELRAGHNNVSSLPETFGELKNLRVLDLYDNEFEEIPKEIVELQNLDGLDLEQNYFSTESIKVQIKSYDTLQNNLRSHDINYQVKHNGAKSYRNCSNSSYSGAKYSYYSNHSNYTNENSDNSSDNNREVNIEEDWDISEDSADEFEPTGLLAPKPRCRMTPFSRPPAIHHNFCPADLHSKSVIHEVRVMQTHGSLQRMTVTEGQFDDA